MKRKTSLYPEDIRHDIDTGAGGSGGTFSKIATAKIHHDQNGTSNNVTIIDKEGYTFTVVFNGEQYGSGEIKTLHPNGTKLTLSVLPYLDPIFKVKAIYPDGSIEEKEKNLEVTNASYLYDATINF